MSETPKPSGRGAAAWNEILVEVPASAEEEAAADLVLSGALGVAADATHDPGEPPTVALRAFFDADRGVKAVESIGAAIAARHHGRFLRRETVFDGRWAEAWIERLKPFAVGRRFVIVPAADLDEPAPAAPPAPSGEEGRIPLRICPSRAFGTGEHASTRLCLEAVEAAARPGRSFLDVGTGSGILAIAAARLGAAPVVGIDDDREAIEVARRNAALNGLGGLLDLRVADAAASAPGRFDVVAANLNGSILRRALPAVAALRAPAGTLILSGILDAEAGEIRAMAVGLGLRRVAESSSEEWCCLVLGDAVA